MRVNPNYSNDMIGLLNQAQQNQQTALQQLSTQRRVSNPSDDPAAEAAMIEENSISASNDQYTASSNSLTGVLNTADSTLSSVVSNLQQAITLGTEGASAGISQSNMNSIAQEVSGIKDQMLSLANTSYAGQYLFGGTVTNTAPFALNASTGAVTYNGNSQQNKVQIGVGLSVSSNLPGSSIFSQSSGNVFTALQSMLSALQAGDQTAVGAAVTQVSSALAAVNTSRVFYGNTVNELTNNESYLSQEKVNITTYQSSLVDVDEAAAAVTSSQAQNVLTATVAAAAQMDQQANLLSYLK
jgi:flagellar hook-associated protein 3 FlgL